MKGKWFGILLVVIVVVLGAAMWTLLDEGSAPPDAPRATSSAGRDASPDGRASTAPDPTAITDPARTVTPAPATGEPTQVVDPTTVNVVERALVVVGRVIDARSGVPVAEADVEVLYPDGQTLGGAESGPDGAYRVEIREAAPARVDVRASALGYSHAFVRDRDVPPAGGEIEVELALRPAFTIEGIVTSARDGTPVEGASVEVRSLAAAYADNWEDVETDASGWYRIEGIEDFPREGIDVWVEPLAHVPMIKSGLQVPEGSDVLRVDFRVWESLTLTGTVVSGANGRPIEDAEVMVASLDPEYESDGEDDLTDEDGEFEMEVDALPFEGLFVQITAEDHAPVRIARLPTPGSDGTIPLGRITLPPAVELSGLVVNRATGEPVTDGEVTICTANAPEGTDGDFCDSADIGPDGRFHLTFEYATPEDAVIVIESNEHVTLRAPLRIPRGERVAERRFELDPVLRLRGTVVDRQGVPLVGALVRLVGAAGESTAGDATAVLTRVDGGYVIELPAGLAAQHALVVEYRDHRFGFGTLEPPPPGRTEVRRDLRLEIDAPRR